MSYKCIKLAFYWLFVVLMFLVSSINATTDEHVWAQCVVVVGGGEQQVVIAKVFGGLLVVVYVIYLRVFHPPCCQSRSYITYYTYISVYNNTVLYYYAVTSVRIHTLTHKFNSIRSVIAWRPCVQHNNTIHNV